MGMGGSTVTTTHKCNGEAHNVKEHERIEKEKKRRFIFGIIGYVATAIGLAVLIPTIVSYYSNLREIKQVNLWAYWLSLVSNALWVVYSAGMQTWPLLGSSALTFVLILMVLIPKYIEVLQLCPGPNISWPPLETTCEP